MLEVWLARMFRSDPMEEKKSCVCCDRFDWLDMVEFDRVRPALPGSGWCGTPDPDAARPSMPEADEGGGVAGVGCW